MGRTVPREIGLSSKMTLLQKIYRIDTVVYQSCI